MPPKCVFELFNCVAVDPNPITSTGTAPHALRSRSGYTPDYKSKLNRGKNNSCCYSLKLFISSMEPSFYCASGVVDGDKRLGLDFSVWKAV
ncbi:hypothetical protein EVAR_92071_1 [Eumeta japonica]|uniref:Uncharacterized protein n=1 Tax=Eumeta variegata TaxID=151549 RepID=A0A4C1SZ08_EUMVA|nr:hypothetical protein EVAR_92071_1 [Eumeta japonica]